MKTMTKIKIARLNRRLNDWILNVLCYPIDNIERKLKRLSTRNTPIYNYVYLDELRQRRTTSRIKEIKSSLYVFNDNINITMGIIIYSNSIFI